MTTQKTETDRNPLSQIAHDMRTPLHTIKVFIDMVPVPDDDDFQKLRDSAKRGVERLIECADQLSAHARSRSE